MGTEERIRKLIAGREGAENEQQRKYFESKLIKEANNQAMQEHYAEIDGQPTNNVVSDGSYGLLIKHWGNLSEVDRLDYEAQFKTKADV